MIKYLQRRYALSHKGAVDNIKGILSCVLQNISFMLPVGLLYLLVGEIMNGTLTTKRPYRVLYDRLHCGSAAHCGLHPAGV